MQQKITQLPVCKVIGEVRDTVGILNEECAELPGQLTQHLFEASAKAQERMKEREIEKEGDLSTCRAASVRRRMKEII